MLRVATGGGTPAPTRGCQFWRRGAAAFVHLKYVFIRTWLPSVMAMTRPHITASQIIDRKMLVCINDLLTSGFIPDLFTAEERDSIETAVLPEVLGPHRAFCCRRELCRGCDACGSGTPVLNLRWPGSGWVTPFHPPSGSLPNCACFAQGVEASHVALALWVSLESVVASVRAIFLRLWLLWFALWTQKYEICFYQIELAVTCHTCNFHGVVPAHAVSNTPLESGEGEDEGEGQGEGQEREREKENVTEKGTGKGEGK